MDRASGRRGKSRDRYFKFNSCTKNEVEKLTTGVVNCPASFLVVRLMLWEGAAWGLKLMERRLQKTAGQGQLSKNCSTHHWSVKQPAIFCC